MNKVECTPQSTEVWRDAAVNLRKERMRLATRCHILQTQLDQIRQRITDDVLSRGFKPKRHE